MVVRWLRLTAAALFVASTAAAQAGFPAGSGTTALQAGQPCTPAMQGALDPGVLPVDTTKLKGLAEEGIPGWLFEALSARSSGAPQSGAAGTVARLYVDPTSLGWKEGDRPGVLRFTADTKIQLYGRRSVDLERPELACGADGLWQMSRVRFTTVAFPPGKALSVRELFRDDAVTLERRTKELGLLEAVAVPLVRNAEPQLDAPCSCPNEKVCYVVDVLTAVPRSVFEDDTGGGSSANSAVLPSPTTPFRQTQLRLQKEAASLILWFRHEQIGKEGACFSDRQLKAWTQQDFPKGLEQWKGFWGTSDGYLQAVASREKEMEKHLPTPPAKAAGGQAAPAPQPAAKKPVRQ